MAELNKDGSVRKKPGPKPGTRFRPRGTAPKKPRLPNEPIAYDRTQDEIDDLIGGQVEEPGIGEQLKIDDVYRGVSITWLAQAFGMDKPTVRKRLAHCPPIGKMRDYEIYSLRQAAAYLVEPKIDIGQYLKSLRPVDLPSYLQDTYWSAMLKRQKYEENARQLWRTGDVLAVFGDMAMTFKSTVQLWVENLDRVYGLTPEMRQTMTQQGDNLLEEIHRIMVEAPLKRCTTSSAEEDHGDEEPGAGGSDEL